MQAATGGIGPSTLSGWIEWGVGLVLWAFSLGVVWQKAMSRINGLGERTNALELASSEKKGRIDKMDRELTELKAAVLDDARRLGGLESGMANLNDHMTEVKVDLGAAIADVKNVILEKNSQVRERIVRIETIMRMEGQDK